MNGPARIAIADDHALFRKGMRNLLEEINGIEVIIEAGNGQELLDQLEHTPVELILLDLSMPVLDGMATLPKLREHYPDIKVLVLSMYDQENFVAHLMKEGASGYLVKDADFEEVERAIKSTLEKGYYFSEQVSEVLLDALKNKQKTIPSLNNQARTPVADDLTPREKEVLRLICDELTTSEIAEKIFLSPRTIEGYRNRLLDKTGAKNTAGLVVYAAKQGWLDAWRSDPMS